MPTAQARKGFSEGTDVGEKSTTLVKAFCRHNSQDVRLVFDVFSCIRCLFTRLNQIFRSSSTETLI